MKNIEKKTIETIRFLSVDAIEKAKSGHPGLPMGTASMAFTLWSKFLKGSGMDPKWPDRDRFILSAGHGSMLLYSLLHLFEYDVLMEDLKSFRTLNSKTPGHPEYGHTPGVETTTGPLGQGIGNAVGMAIAEKRLAKEFNKPEYNIVDHYTYVIAGDGDLMEGVASEAASLAGHLKLGKLITLYDDNNITIDGTTEISFTEDVKKRFESYGWEVFEVENSNDVDEIEKVIKKARENLEKPSLIKVPTTIGYGSPNKEGKSAAHGAPLGEGEIKLTKERSNWDHPDFYVAKEVRDYIKEIVERREAIKADWEETFDDYCEDYPEKARQWKRWFSKEIPDSLLMDEELWDFVDKPKATRKEGGKVINIVSKHLENLIGGSADLNASTKTTLKQKDDFQWNTPHGNNINFGVREHGMGAVLNGMSLHGGLRVFGSTFLVFSDYMKPSIRLAALMKQPVIYVFTHDSIALGEDGPTHQPIEQLTSLRSIPNLTLFRPADSKETVIAWMEALKNTNGPSAICLTRQSVPLLEGVNKGAHSGGYILRKEDGDKPDIILMGSGSEVSLLTKAHEKLKEEGINSRVVSMISLEEFDLQPKVYKESVLPKEVKKRISVEAASTYGWHKYVGDQGRVIGIDEFGASAPGEILMEKYGFTVDNIVKNAKEILDK
ncbi:MAG: transketolase [Firmicutes bacterium]|nr:transketolase [Bacillota bacterium]